MLRVRRPPPTLELTTVSAGERTTFESYECADCGGTGTYINEYGVPGVEIIRNRFRCSIRRSISSIRSCCSSFQVPRLQKLRPAVSMHRTSSRILN